MATARINGGTGADIQFENRPFAQGAFKIVYRGKYENGPRRGQYCVAKMFKEGCVYEGFYFAEEMNLIYVTEHIVSAFNAAGILGHGRRVRVNIPDIATCIDTDMRGSKALVEPFIENFDKFNSNTGWVKDSGEWGEAMQALSHFSYHATNGRHLLCDLQGGSYRDRFILTDPVIMSEDGNCGPGDLGEDGMICFFSHHRCGRFCSSRWITPRGAGGSANSQQRGTRYSRNPMSGY